MRILLNIPQPLFVMFSRLCFSSDEIQFCLLHLKFIICEIKSQAQVTVRALNACLNRRVLQGSYRYSTIKFPDFFVKIFFPDQSNSMLFSSFP